MSSVKQIWTGLSPARKKKAIMLAIVLCVLIVGLLGYKVRNKPKAAAQSAANSTKTLTLDNGLLKKSEYEEMQSQMSDFKNDISYLRQLKQEKQQGMANSPMATGQGIFPDKNRVQPQPPMPKFPPLPRETRASSFPPGYPPPPELKTPKPAPQIVGGIEVVSGPAGSDLTNPRGDSKEKAKDGKKKETVYLPPSFMEATLLTGLDAPTADGAKGQPVPVLLRIKAPAVLPNRVKANLKGCFVIAEGYGSLADERAHLRLVTLSCVAKNGSAVIDQKVKGFVVDDDGKIGLRGRVVSKMGSALARSFIAGFFGGLGQATQAATMTTSISALGTTQTVNPSKLLEAGAGSGVAQSANQLEKFYLELAKQAMPVVEVGATRDVTLVVSEGANLEIKDFCNRMGDEDKCEN